MKTLILENKKENIDLAAKIIARGGLVAFPTETVYGLGANALDGEAVGKVYAAKGRPSDNPMIVHISSKDDIKKLTSKVTEDMKLLMENFWPGPLTMVVKRSEIVPLVTTGGLETVAIRMPDSEIALKLIEGSGCPIAAPSANLSGRPSPTTAQHVIDDLDGRIDAIIKGENCRVGIESTVLDMTLETPMILRPGILTKEVLSAAIDKNIDIDPTLLSRPDPYNNQKEGLLQDMGKDYKPKSPGMKYKHYAPKAEMIIFEGNCEKIKAEIEATKKERELKGQRVGIILYENKDSEKAAHDFFAKLRDFDKKNIDVILAGALEEDGIGFSVMNRMLKSAGYNIKKVK